VRLLSWMFITCCLAMPAYAQKESLLIGPGDQVHVTVFDTPELDETARVTDSGELPLVLGGTIKLASLTPAAASRAIETDLVRHRIMNTPHVLVTVVSYGTQNVTITGQVVRPGTYPIDTPRPLVDALSLAGGFTELADRHVIVQRRTTGEKVRYLVANNPSDAPYQGEVVYPGDIITVPKTGIVYVLGDVGRPGGYPMNNNDSGLTVLQAVAAAGGTQTSAVPSHARIIRHTDDGGYTEDRLELSDMQKGKKRDFTLEPNDIIYVPFSYFRNAALGLTGIAASASSAIIYAK
jgi:polysaccharide export outer membrane protein